MGKKTTGISVGRSGRWEVDKWVDSVRLRARFDSFEEAQNWLTRQLEFKRAMKIHGVSPAHSFNEAAGRFMLENQHLATIESYGYHLKSVMPFIKDLALDEIHDATLRPFVDARLHAGISHKTINLSLATVRRVLNLASRSWRDESTNKFWLSAAPFITLLPLVGHQRAPRPITWGQQDALLKELPSHLAEMAIFALNTGVRDDVVCNLQWDWEIPIPELGISVFETPIAHVKGRRRSRLVVCNSLAQAAVERARGAHATHVFVMRWRHHPLGPIQTMNNTAWQRARKRADLRDLHVHDLRHTVGMRLREAGVAQSTIADALWHSSNSITQHYSMAQIRELYEALEKIAKPSGCWNKSLETLKAERNMRKLLTMTDN